MQTQTHEAAAEAPREAIARGRSLPRSRPRCRRCPARELRMVHGHLRLSIDAPARSTWHDDGGGDWWISPCETQQAPHLAALGCLQASVESMNTRRTEEFCVEAADLAFSPRLGSWPRQLSDSSFRTSLTFSGIVGGNVHAMDLHVRWVTRTANHAHLLGKPHS